MAKAYRPGLMGPSIKETGSTTCRTERESSLTPMETYTMGNGKLGKHMAMVSIADRTGENTKAIGPQIYKTAMAEKCGQMEAVMTGTSGLG